MNSHWISCTISDLGTVVGGSTPSTKVSENYTGGKIPWITPKDLAGYNHRYISRGERNITEQGFKSSSLQMLPQHSVLFTSRAPIGYIAIAENDLCTNQGFKSVVPNSETDYMFLYYLLKFNKENIENMGSGTTFKEVSGTTMRNIPVFVPEDKQTQQRIASVLSALDSKIEQNTAINNNLEQQAQALFKSWFIDFEPFGGTMPEDWEERPLTDIPCFTLLKPGIKSFDGEKYYVATADADKDGITNKTTFVTMQNKPSRANMQPLVDSVWFAKMKNSRKNILINKLWSEEINKFILSTGFYGFSCGHNTLYYLWCFIASDAFDELKNNLCNGTTMEAINNDGLGQISLNVPPLETIQNFNQQVAPMFEMIAHNKFENEQLAEIRDALLPKLMSGEIDVSKVDVSDPSCLDKSLFNKETE